jgi:SAM-dependent methyltransferase
MIRYFDKKNNRLVYIGSASNDKFWDNIWNVEDLGKLIKEVKDPALYNEIIKTTKKYLPIGSRVLEGGCGLGDIVYALGLHGYDAYGVDYAKETVRKIKKYAPELKVTYGDVRSLHFDNDFFNGYWSLGVIEHYYYGYDDIINEMYRVLTLGGILFMTVPTMSWIRKFKAMTGKYPEYLESEAFIKTFYQFALDSKGVVKNFRDRGFELLGIKNIDGFYGMSNEIGSFKPLFQFLHEKKTLPRELLIKMFESFGNIFANHLTLYIMRKIERSC